ncbi:hypothetical protein [Flavobacterium sp. ZS1P14]|uniref:hypothetical protein n=1 Tax=Flavobacterium sp. ZS1P14 TaxID=3401729 RepID=UPI003AB04139
MKTIVRLLFGIYKTCQVLRLLYDFVWNVFSNIAITNSEYLKSDAPNIERNKVEFVPLYNIKTETEIRYKNFISSIQFTYVSSQIAPF